MTNRDVIKIAANKSSLITKDGSLNKKKVAVYARVSTMKDLQKTSFELQVSTYHKLVTSNPLWEFAGIFADFGKSGTNVTQRTEFNKMVELARLGEIDIILTKSISRFTRNTVSGLKAIQELRDLGVEVRFEKENMTTNDTSFDFFLTIFTSVAEEESKINSSNVLWTYKKKMQNGGNTTPRIYGYTFDREGNFIINPKQAPAVQLIFDLYIEGKTLNEIIDSLNKKGFKTLNGKDRFSVGTLNRILRNEKYAGDMLLQKTTVSKIGTRDSIPNTTKPKYYVSDNHEPIVSKETFNKVQEIVKSRANKFYTPSKVKTDFEYANYVYSVIGKKFYKSKVNHRNTKHEIKLLEVLDNNRNRILDAKNIYYTQIDKLLDEGVDALLKSKFIKDEINNLLEKTIESSGIDDEIKEFTFKAESLSNELSNLNNLNIDASAKNQIRDKLDFELSGLNEELLALRYKKLMNYTYEKNIPMFMRKLKDLKNKRNVDLKEIFNYVIAIDRDNLILCIHLSNRNINEIDLNAEIDNIPLKSGYFKFIQTRLHIDVNWKIIII